MTYFLHLTMQSKSSPLSIYSIMRNSCLGVSMISYSWIMLGCLINLRIWISLETRSTSATSMIFSFSRIFMATFSPVGMWVADLTFPKVPFPNVFPQIGWRSTNHIAAYCASPGRVQFLSFSLEIFVHYPNRLIIILIHKSGNTFSNLSNSLTAINHPRLIILTSTYSSSSTISK